MAGGIFGAELDLGRTGQVFGDGNTFGDNAVTTVTGNILGAFGPIRPYAVGGVGLIRTPIDELLGTRAVTRRAIWASMSEPA